MTPKQIAILNSLVTFSAENIPGGLSEDEREVAQIVGRWALQGSMQSYNYEVANASAYDSVRHACTDYAERGWRVVAAIGARGPGHSHQIIVERPVGMTHPDD